MVSRVFLGRDFAGHATLFDVGVREWSQICAFHAIETASVGYTT